MPRAAPIAVPAVPAGSPAGLCPLCLLRLGAALSAELAGELGSEASTDVRRDRVPKTTSLRVAGQRVRSGTVRSGLSLACISEMMPDAARLVRPGSPEMPDLSGQPSRYQLIGELARGGMGAIFQGRDLDLGRDLAVKVIREEHRDHPEMVRRFVEEAQIGGQLQHPGIMPVHELGRFPDGRLFIAMKLVRGRTLAALLECAERPDEDRMQFLSVFEQVCQAMAYAHSRGVIHRDLKPSNVMVGAFGEVQVMDWGLAKVLDQGGVADEERASARAAAPPPSGRCAAGRTGRNRGPARCSARRRTWHPSRPGASWTRSTSGPTSSRWARSSARSSPASPRSRASPRPSSTARRSGPTCRTRLARLDACGSDAELVELAQVVPGRRAEGPAAGRGRGGRPVVGVSRAASSGGCERPSWPRPGPRLGPPGERRRRLLTLALAASVLATALIGVGRMGLDGPRAAAARAIDSRRGRSGPLRGLEEARPGSRRGRERRGRLGRGDRGRPPRRIPPRWRRCSAPSCTIG